MCKIFPYLIPQKQMKWRYEFLVQFKTEYTKLVTFIEVLIRVVINLIAFRYRHTVIHWISLNFSQSVTKKKCISATNKIYIKIKIVHSYQYWFIIGIVNTGTYKMIEDYYVTFHNKWEAHEWNGFGQRILSGFVTSCEECTGVQWESTVIISAHTPYLHYYQPTK